MARYSSTAQTPAGSDLGLINLTGSGAIRAKLYDLIIGSDATPGDQAGEFMLNRSTTTGTGGTAVTPEPLDPLTSAAVAAATTGVYSTTQPTDTANTELLMIALNQRATFRWIAAPDSELISIATAANGLLLRSVGHTGTPNVNVTVLHEE